MRICGTLHGCDAGQKYTETERKTIKTLSLSSRKPWMCRRSQVDSKMSLASRARRKFWTVPCCILNPSTLHFVCRLLCFWLYSTRIAGSVDTCSWNWKMELFLLWFQQVWLIWMFQAVATMLLLKFAFIPVAWQQRWHRANVGFEGLWYTQFLCGNGTFPSKRCGIALLCYFAFCLNPWRHTVRCWVEQRLYLKMLNIMISACSRETTWNCFR